MKKLLLYLAIILVLFAALFFINKQSEKAADTVDNPYGISASKLDPATRKQFNDPNYQNVILPDALDSKIASKEETFVYFFSPLCSHCVRTTPVVNPIAKDAGVDLKQMNLLEFEDGWNKYRITGTPTIVVFRDGKEAARIENGITATAGDGGNTEAMYKEFFAKNKTK
jgi:thioredoxin 1